MYYCPICASLATLYDVVDFNKSCNGARFLPLSGMPIYYVICENCNFCYSPEIYQWDKSKFAKYIYNSEYIRVDPDYVQKRPQENFSRIEEIFSILKEKNYSHLDYGGGNGTLSLLLKNNGWNSTSYDPFENSEASIQSLGKFDFITAFEVFEHVPDVNTLLENLSQLIKPQGMIYFSTGISDHEILKDGRLTWWYASPRNGHISLFSNKSLEILAEKHAFKIQKYQGGLVLAKDFSELDSLIKFKPFNKPKRKFFSW